MGLTWAATECVASAAVERLLVTYVDRETVRCPPNTGHSPASTCFAALRSDDLIGCDAVSASASATPDSLQHL